MSHAPDLSPGGLRTWDAGRPPAWPPGGARAAAVSARCLRRCHLSRPEMSSSAVRRQTRGTAEMNVKWSPGQTRGGSLRRRLGGLSPAQEGGSHVQGAPRGAAAAGQGPPLSRRAPPGRRRVGAAGPAPARELPVCPRPSGGRFRRCTREAKPRADDRPVPDSGPGRRRAGRGGRSPRVRVPVPVPGKVASQALSLRLSAAPEPGERARS